MRPRTPQEKKTLSLRKDRRNVYGESQRAARCIPQRKKLRNRANRHEQNAPLPTAPTQLAVDDADAIESAIHRKAPKIWNKVPDAPLGGLIAEKLERRVSAHARKMRSKLAAALSRGHFSGKCPTCRADVYILVGRHHGEHFGSFCAVGEGRPNPTFVKVKIRPCQEGQLPPHARQIHGLCIDAGDASIAESVCRLFGSSTCPRCHEPLEIAQAVDATQSLRRLYAQRGLASTALLPWTSDLTHWLYHRP